MVGSELNRTRRKRGKKEKKNTRREWSSLPFFFFLDNFLTALSERLKQGGDQGAPPVKTLLFVWFWLALSTDCKTKARNCNIASFKGSILTSLFLLCKDYFKFVHF